MTQTVILRGQPQRNLAKQFIDKAPENSVVKISPLTRSNEQNNKMWALIEDVMNAMPEGRQHTKEVWKAIFMNALGHETAFAMGINNEIFPIGFKSSQLSVRQMSDLIEVIYAYGAKHNVKWSEKYE
jgi:hypothetical protein